MFRPREPQPTGIPTREAGSHILSSARLPHPVLSRDAGAGDLDGISLAMEDHV